MATSPTAEDTPPSCRVTRAEARHRRNDHPSQDGTGQGPRHLGDRAERAPSTKSQRPAGGTASRRQGKESPLSTAQAATMIASVISTAGGVGPAVRLEPVYGRRLDRAACPAELWQCEWRTDRSRSGASFDHPRARRERDGRPTTTATRMSAEPRPCVSHPRYPSPRGARTDDRRTRWPTP